MDHSIPHIRDAIQSLLPPPFIQGLASLQTAHPALLLPTHCLLQPLFSVCFHLWINTFHKELTRTGTLDTIAEKGEGNREKQKIHRLARKLRGLDMAFGVQDTGSSLVQGCPEQQLCVGVGSGKEEDSRTSSKGLTCRMVKALKRAGTGEHRRASIRIVKPKVWHSGLEVKSKSRHHPRMPVQTFPELFPAHCSYILSHTIAPLSTAVFSDLHPC